MIKAAIFDLDGTLADTFRGHTYSMNLVLKKFGFDEITIEQTYQYIGNGYQKFVELSLKATADRLYAKAEKLERKKPDEAMELEMQADDVMAAYEDACEEYLKVYAVHFLHDSDAYPGMRETLAQMRENGIKLACVTNKPVVATKKTLDQAFGPDYFDYVVCDDGKVPRKPDPTGCRMVLDAFRINNDEAIYVGDTRTDMMTAHNARLKAVGCIYGSRGRKELEENKADFLIEKPEDLLEIVNKL